MASRTAASRRFRTAQTRWSYAYHLVAPDHIGFGASAAPAVDTFDYGFDRLTGITLALLDRLGLDRFALYVQDYGASVGLRIASRHPERVTAIVTQSGDA
ncbi:alpha/beta fold hydrolase [Streptomyces roseoviridis]|uniref:Alpha/beta fold hydrolase n=1 Tax=Streptomyces roseoviridis TaxID=67361 RepID=A0ABV5QIQ4_9ACTN